MKTFKQYLEEAIINSNIEDVRQHISEVISHLFGNKQLTGYKFYELLNNVLNHYQIYVRQDNENKATGEFQKSTGNIYINVPLKYYRQIKNNEITSKQFFDSIIPPIEHELIHRAQDKLRKKRQKQNYSFWSDEKNLEPYLSDKDEIMAYAKMAIIEYRNNLNKDEIRTLLRTGNYNKYPNRVMDVYNKLFIKDSSVIKRLLKYMYLYNENI